MKCHDPYEYPHGRSHLEPLSVILTSVLMAVSAALIIGHSAEDILNDTISPVVGWETVALMGSAVLIKAVLAIVYMRVGTVNTVKLS